MTTFANYPIDLVQPHPNNVRRVATADQPMVDSIVAAGILEPVVLGPDTGDGVRWLIAGNRRWDGAVQAGLTELPAVLRDDLVTESQQIEAMLVENLHRSDLTVMEEADAYEQLQLFGMDTAAISAATGRAKSTVTSRLKLTTLTSKAQERLHGGDITLKDAEALLEFAESPEVLAELEAAIGTNDFTWKVNSARENIKRAARNAETVAEFEELGAARVDTSGERTWKNLPSFWSEDLQDAAGHTHCECLGYVDYGPTSYAVPQLVCMDPDSHQEHEDAARAGRTTSLGGTADERQAERQAEWDKQRQEREAAAEARRVAAGTRVDWLAEHWAAALPAKGKQHTSLVAAARALLPSVIGTGFLDDAIVDSTLDRALGLEHEPSYLARASRNEAHATALMTAPAGDVLRALVGVLAALTEEALSYAGEGGHRGYGDEQDHLAAAWSWLEDAGYPMSTADTELRADALKTDTEGDDT